MTRKTVGQTTFEVPERFIIEHDIAFLPESQNDGLTFRLNLEASGPEEIMVGVDAVADACQRSGQPVTDMLPRTCAIARGEATAQPIGELTKSLRTPGIASQWDYRSESGGVVAMCSRSSRGGSCKATFAWRDLVYSVSFNDSEVARLAELKTQVDRLLEEWSNA